MTHEEMKGEIRAQSDMVSERRVRKEQVNWWIYNGLKDFCIRTECSQQAADYTISYENGAWRTDYPLPGYRVEDEAFPYSDSTYAGANFKKAKRLYIDGELAEYTSIDRIYEPTASTAPQAGTDTQGESFAGCIFDGTGEDTTKQYWYLKYNKFWCPYPAVKESVTARLHYIWIPDILFKNAIEMAAGAPSRMEVAARVPAIWHSAIVTYGLFKMFDFLNDRRRRDSYKRDYNDMVREAKGDFKNLMQPGCVRGVFY